MAHLTFGPFGDQTKASIGLCRMMDSKYGTNIGIAWQENDTVLLLRPPVPARDGTTSLVVVESTGAAPAPPNPANPPKAEAGPSKARMAWDTLGVGMDIVGAVLAYTALEAAFAAVIIAGADAAAIALVVFAAVEIVDAILMMATDGMMTFAEYKDRGTGGTKHADALKASPPFRFIQTWGPIIALPNIGKDIMDIRRLRTVGADLTELGQQVSERLGGLVPRWIEKGEQEVLARMQALAADAREIEENAKDIASDLKQLYEASVPADLFSMANNYLNLGDIKEGLEKDYDGFMEHAKGWTNSAETYWHTHNPFAGAPPAHVAAQKTMTHIKMHVLTAKPVKKK